MNKLKTVVALFITSFLFAFSCTQSSDEAGESMGKNSEIVKGIYEAFAKGDVPAVLGAFDSGIQWWEADGFLYADGNPFVGPQAIAEGVFQRIVTDVENFAVTPTNIIDGGQTVVVEGRYTGVLKATGAQVDAQFAHVWELQDSKVVRFQQYTDTKQWAEAAGS
jgi:hypothetical protein